jgi:uncharacterized protein (TIGR02594 family)
MRLTKTVTLILLCSVAAAVLADAAIARPHHRTRAAMAAPATAVSGADRDARYSDVAQAPTAAMASVVKEGSRRHGRRARLGDDPRVATEPNASFIAAQSHSNSTFGGATSDSLVNEARRYIGTNPTGRGSQWCGAFLDMVLKRTGRRGGGNLSSSYARYGTRVSGPQVGAIAVMHGHVGIVSGVDANGNPIVVSGNHNRTVAESVYPRGRVYAYVMP